MQSEKWIIPRNIVVDSLLSMNIFDYETSLSFIPEFLLRHLFYPDLQDIAPPEKGLFTGKPMCNDQLLTQIRAGKASWLRGDIESFESDGIVFNHRDRGVPSGGPGRKELIHGDVVVLATGFTRPDPISCQTLSSDRHTRRQPGICRLFHPSIPKFVP